MTDLTKYLTIFRRRLRLRDGWHLAQRTLWIAALAMLLIQLAGRLWPIELLWLWSLLPFGLWLVASLGYALFRPMSLMRTAYRVDGELALRERLSTALAFQPMLANVHGGEASGPEAGVYSQDWRRLAWRQREDALEAARAIQPAQAFPLGWQPRRLGLAAALILAALVSAWLPNPMDAVLAERAAVRQEAARQAERAEALAQQVAQAQELTADQREELMRQLRELAEKLRQNNGNLEQAMADLSNLEKSLQEKLDPNALAQQANMEALAEQLSKLAQKPRDPNKSAAEAAAQALADLAAQMGKMTPEERQQAADQLAQMAAQTSQTGDQKLAESLSAMAQAMQSSAEAANAQNATQQAQASAQAQAAANQARGDLKESEARLSNQQALQQTLQQLQNSRQQMAQAARAAAAQAGRPGQSGQQTNQPGQGQQPGQGNQPGQGQNGLPGQGQNGQPGQGQNPGQGRPGGGGGSNANTLPPFRGGPSNVRPPQGNAANPAPGELPGQVYAPWERPGANGQQVFIPGQDTGQGETTSSQGQSNLPGSSNPALVPYSQVFGNYYNTAIQSLQQSYVPSALQDYVKNYFSELAPK